jgi:hypothetical protein
MLAERVASVLEKAEQCSAGHPELDELRRALRVARARLAEPMRVAVAGRIKRGKSTLINGLLRTDLAAAGPLELTYHVTEFRHEPVPSINLTYTDGRPAQSRSWSDLESLPTRGALDAETRRALRTIEVAWPADLLRRFRLLDTPGVDSVFDDDSRIAMDRLGIDPETVRAASSAAVDGADAVVYVFSRALARTDAELLAEFNEVAAGALAPVKAIGVLSRADSYWPPNREHPAYPDRHTWDPLDRAVEIARRYVDDTAAGRLFYDIRPVIGRLAAGAYALTDGDLAALRELAGAEPEALFRAVRDVRRFLDNGVESTTVGRGCRAVLIERLGQYGVHLAARLLREGLAGADLRDELYRRSGVPALADVISEHFGNRTQVIKLDAALRRCQAVRDELRPVARGPAADALRGVGELLGELAAREHGFRELDALGAYYRGDAHLDEAEVAELLAVTGEHGRACAARLRMPPDTPIARLSAATAERRRYWARRRADDPGSALITFLADTYEVIEYHLVQAGHHLNLDA